MPELSARTRMGIRWRAECVKGLPGPPGSQGTLSHRSEYTSGSMQRLALTYVLGGRA
jgi:hypothetical protein